MEGPIRGMGVLCVPELAWEDVVCHWRQGASYLFRIRVRYRGKRGDLLCYANPPVHQIGNPGLDAFLKALDAVSSERESLDFLILAGSNDPVHAGGDLKETLGRLDATLEKKKELLSAGASPEEIDALFEWGDARLRKGLALYRAVRSLAEKMRVVAVCGGGMRYGGSAELALMADVVLGDSRSGMCFSEAQIGLIPGWGGIGRVITKAGMSNARTMAMTAREVDAASLLSMGIYNEVVEISDPLPRKGRSGNDEQDREEYRRALQRNNDASTAKLLPRALELAVLPWEEVPCASPETRVLLGSDEEVEREVARRKDPYTYQHLWGKPIREVAAEIRELGRPLAPQSIEALEGLFRKVALGSFEEDAFVEEEMYADAALYRDPRLRTGILATLEQKVADFREV